VIFKFQLYHSTSTKTSMMGVQSKSMVYIGHHLTRDEVCTLMGVDLYSKISC
jgi:hypothetical protein